MISSTQRELEDEAASKFLCDVSDILKERGGVYPPYSEEANKVAAIWNAIFPERQIKPHEVPLIFRITKMVRGASGKVPDSLLDEAGYLARQAGMQ